MEKTSRSFELHKEVNMTKQIITTLCILIFSSLYSQQRTALRNSIYSGTDGVLINPSFSTDQGVFVSVNLLGADFFLMNNLLSVKSSRYTDLQDIGTKLTSNTNGLFNQYLFSNISVEGPSVSVNYGRYGGGFFTRFRTMVDFRNPPEELAQLYVNGFDYTSFVGKSIQFKNVELNTLSWAEYGINFSKMLSPRNYRAVMIGGSIKYLQPVQASMFRIDEFSYLVGSTGNYIDRIKASYKTGIPTGSSWFSGGGAALDFGISLKEYRQTADHYHPHKKYSDCAFWDYKFRWSASLLDFGLVQINGQNSADAIDTTFKIPVYTAQTKDIGSGVQTQSLKPDSKPFWVFMPSTINLEADYALDHSFYLNVGLTSSLLPRSMPGLQSPGYLTISPRFERKNIAVLLPFTLYRFSQPLLGLCLRIRSFYVGTNSIVPLFVPTSIHGVNAYLGIKINIYRNHACDKKPHKEKPQKIKPSEFKKEPQNIPQESNPPKNQKNTVPINSGQEPQLDLKPNTPREDNSMPKDNLPKTGEGTQFSPEHIHREGPENLPQLDQDPVKETLDEAPNMEITKPEKK